MAEAKYSQWPCLRVNRKLASGSAASRSGNSRCSDSRGRSRRSMARARSSGVLRRRSRAGQLGNARVQSAGICRSLSRSAGPAPERDQRRGGFRAAPPARCRHRSGSPEGGRVPCGRRPRRRGSGGPAQIHAQGRAGEEQGVGVDGVQFHVVADVPPSRLSPALASTTWPRPVAIAFSARRGLLQCLPSKTVSAPPRHFTGPSLSRAEYPDVHHRPRAGLDFADFPQRHAARKSRQVEAMRET